MNLYVFGHWIYFDKMTGEILHDTGEVHHTDPDYEMKRDPFSNIKKLMERDPESVGIIKLEPGEFAQDFSEGSLARVNPDSLELEFIYIDPNSPQDPPPTPQPPLTEQVAKLEQENTLLKAQNSALSERADFIEDVIAEMANKVYQ
ncbi:hypothetical protein AK95_14570 [Paenibacillus sp. LC231]|uniref:hypothetical protein n=1 Tax=Paenibacillus sp. LC231 TaxID=1120679 RepID=UPI0008DE9F67|nr:hypothetical protein [Paenibacillus sp. LC231]OIB04837.1 hypothetical protein AK95_14570 [Paenibacillus sp. LC231]